MSLSGAEEKRKNLQSKRLRATIKTLTSKQSLEAIILNLLSEQWDEAGKPG